MEDEARESGSSTFGRLLRRYRLAVGLSQRALADRARLSLDGISSLERGHRRSPQRETLALLADALALNDEQRRAFESAATRPASPRHRDRAPGMVGPWLSARSTTLPLALTRFVGREVELDEIAALVREHRLVTLTGAGGIGKTQTALQVATALRDATESRVCFVPFGPIADPSLFSAAVASPLGVQEVPGHPLLETLIAYLKNENLLLIFDNCEHVIAEATSVVAAVLRSCPRVWILATSREPLRAAGERAYRLPSLAAKDAIELFVDRAQSADAHFALGDDNGPTVADLCRRLDGIPLAIELAAARVNVLPLKVLFEKLEDRLQILTHGERTASRRQQTMRATIDWSYDLLAAPEQLFFERLSVFAGGCTLAAATTVCASEGARESDVLNMMASLVQKSLVVTDLDGREPRYRLLESFREYARERLAMRGEAQAISRLHALACFELAERINRTHDCDPAVIWQGVARDERDNWRAALRWALVDRGDVLLGQRLVGELGQWQFGNVEAKRHIAAACELLDDRTPKNVLAGLRLAEAHIAGNLMEYRSELASSQSALALYHDLGDSLGMVQAQICVSRALIFLGRRAEAKPLLEKILRMARGLPGRNRRSVALILRLLAYATAGDAEAVRCYIAEALQIYDALGNRYEAANALIDLSECEFCAGNAELALRRATEASDVSPPLNPYADCIILNNSSLYLVALARYDEAKTCAREALGLALENQWDVQAAWALERCAVITGLQPEIPTEQSRRASAIAARILGFVDARLAALTSARYEWVQPQHDQALAALHDALGTDAVASLFAEGARMTENQAVEAALAI
jgi:predicted ATPase/transcriptional regulator with XRE-family HTH domain